MGASNLRPTRFMRKAYGRSLYLTTDHWNRSWTWQALHSSPHRLKQYREVPSVLSLQTLGLDQLLTTLSQPFTLTAHAFLLSFTSFWKLHCHCISNIIKPMICMTVVVWSRWVRCESSSYEIDRQADWVGCSIVHRRKDISIIRQLYIRRNYYLMHMRVGYEWKL